MSADNILMVVKKSPRTAAVYDTNFSWISSTPEWVDTCNSVEGAKERLQALLAGSRPVYEGPAGKARVFCAQYQRQYIVEYGVVDLT